MCLQPTNRNKHVRVIKLFLIARLIILALNKLKMYNF
nr:MAG TPA: hypothetical protein [Caudoviricetes sp.]